jgi:hypothetical protein
MVNDLFTQTNTVTDIRLASKEPFGGDMHRHFGIDTVLDVSPHRVTLQNIVDRVEFIDHLVS